MLNMNTTNYLSSNTIVNAENFLTPSINVIHDLYSDMVKYLSDLKRDNFVLEPSMTLEVHDLLGRTLNTDNDMEDCLKYFISIGILAQDIYNDDEELSVTKESLDRWLSQSPVHFYWRTNKSSRELERPFNKEFCIYTTTLQSHVRRVLTSKTAESWRMMISNLLWLHAISGFARFLEEIQVTRKGSWWNPNPRIPFPYEILNAGPKLPLGFDDTVNTEIYNDVLFCDTKKIPFLVTLGLPEYDGINE